MKFERLEQGVQTGHLLDSGHFWSLFGHFFGSCKDTCKFPSIVIVQPWLKLFASALLQKIKSQLSLSVNPSVHLWIYSRTYVLVFAVSEHEVTFWSLFQSQILVTFILRRFWPPLVWSQICLFPEYLSHTSHFCSSALFIVLSYNLYNLVINLSS